MLFTIVLATVRFFEMRDGFLAFANLALTSRENSPMHDEHLRRLGSPLKMGRQAPAHQHKRTIWPNSMRWGCRRRLVFSALAREE